MADDTVVVEPELKLEAPNMDEQSAAPKEVAAEVVPEKEKVGGGKTGDKPASKEEQVVAEEVAPQTDWKDKELKRKHAQIKEKERELEAVRKENEDLRALATRPKEGEEVQPKTPAQNMSRDQIQEAAKALREQERYEEDLAKINEAGQTSYKQEWNKALENLATMGTVETATMQGILATDDPAKVLFELGQNPGEFQRIMELRPERRQTEFVKLSMKAAPKKTVSSAPEPVESVRGRVVPSALPQDSDDDETWYAKWHAMQEAKRKKSA